MTTITIKINERSKKGKAFFEIIKSDDKKPKKRKSIYSDAFIAKMKKAEKNIKNGDVTRLNLDDIWGSIL